MINFPDFSVVNFLVMVPASDGYFCSYCPSNMLAILAYSKMKMSIIMQLLKV